MRQLLGVILLIAWGLPALAADSNEDGERTFRCWRIESDVDSDRLTEWPIAVEAHDAREAITRCIRTLQIRRERERRHSAMVRIG